MTRVPIGLICTLAISSQISSRCFSHFQVPVILFPIIQVKCNDIPMEYFLNVKLYEKCCSCQKLQRMPVWGQRYCFYWRSVFHWQCPCTLPGKWNSHNFTEGCRCLNPWRFTLLLKQSSLVDDIRLHKSAHISYLGKKASFQIQVEKTKSDHTLISFKMLE